MQLFIDPDQTGSVNLAQFVSGIERMAGQDVHVNAALLAMTFAQS
jgi:hypothetical protein